MSTAGADRITLFTGDIFIGTILTTEENQFVFERFGFRTVHAQWDVKKIESGVETIGIDGATASLSIPAYDKTIEIISQPPIEASHLEFYPARHYQVTSAWRYLRGYLVNRTQNSFWKIDAQLKYYDDNKKLLFWQNVELFDVFPMTMKCFIVDTRFAPWDKVTQLAIVFIGSKKMPAQ
jgi:hypothetical protein